MHWQDSLARKPTTHDPFNAVAEPKLRRVLETIGARELSVNEIVELLGWPQPMVSKHLGVLKQVGLVREMLLDGFIARPNDGRHNPLGIGSEALFRWYGSGYTEYTTSRKVTLKGE